MLVNSYVQLLNETFPHRTCRHSVCDLFTTCRPTRIVPVVVVSAAAAIFRVTFLSASAADTGADARDRRSRAQSERQAEPAGGRRPRAVEQSPAQKSAAAASVSSRLKQQQVGADARSTGVRSDGAACVG